MAIGRASASCRLTRRVAPSGVMPGDALPGLRHDLPGRLEQLGQVVDRAGQPPAPPPRGRVVLPRSRSSSALARARRSACFALASSRSASLGSGGGQLGQLAGDPPHGGLRLVAAGRRAGPQLGGDRVRPLARPPATGPAPWCGSRHPAARIRLPVAAIRRIALASNPESVG